MEEPREPVAEVPDGRAPDERVPDGTEPDGARPDGADAGGTDADGADAHGADAGDTDARGAAGPQPLGVVVTPTGDAAVDAQLRRLADADHLAASGHLEVYEDVHRGLRDTLAALDRHPGPAGPSGAPRSPQPSATYDNRS
ncbi:hypothetical protein ACH4FX_39655 [Streptomyces sp. NPDC018019]|uniref:hypothetical protein n=1 Tax=Streptomyces sp. NPDC018019 TaxID=3365030 RepID=UPI00379E3504